MRVVTFDNVQDRIDVVEVWQHERRRASPILPQGVDRLHVHRVEERVEARARRVRGARVAVHVPRAEAAPDVVEAARREREVHAVNELAQVVSVLDEAPPHPPKSCLATGAFRDREDVQEGLQNEEQASVVVHDLAPSVGEHVLRRLRVAHDLDHGALQVGAPSERGDGVSVARHLAEKRAPRLFMLTKPAVEAHTDELAVRGLDHDGAKGVVAGVALEYEVGAPKVLVHGLVPHVLERARPQCDLFERSTRQRDDPVVVLRSCRISYREQQVAAAQPAHEAQGELERNHLADELAHRAHPHRLVVLEHELRRGRQLEAPRVRDADRHRAGVQHEAQELEPRAQFDAELLGRQCPPKRRDEGHDLGHALVVRHLAHGAAEVVQVHDERRHEAAASQLLGRDRGELREGEGRRAEAEREAVVHIVDALEGEAQQGPEPLVDLGVRVGAEQVDRPEPVPRAQLLDEVVKALHLERQPLQELVQDATIVNEAKLARSPRLGLDDERHHHAGPHADALALGDKLVPS